MGLDPDDKRSASEQIAAALRGQIASGELGPGDKLPAGAELTAAYGVAKQTVTNALRQLQDEGLVVNRAGRGVFVRTNPDATEAADLLRLIAGRLDSLESRVVALEERGQ
jgi:DNA-binding GntR family transcriptional regulator